MRKVFLSILFVLMGAGAVYIFVHFTPDESLSLSTARTPQAKKGMNEVKAKPTARKKAVGPSVAENLAKVLQRIQAGESTDLAADYFGASRLAKQLGEDSTYITAMRHLIRAFPNNDYAVKVAPELGDVFLAQNDFESARKMYSFAYERVDSYAARRRLAAKMDPIVERIIFSRRNFSECVFHRVQAGDTLIGIASKYNCPYRFIQFINRKKNAMLRVGERLKVISGPEGNKMSVKVVISKIEFTLTVYLNGVYLRSYPVAIGREDATPTATFKIIDRIKHPAWHAPDGNIYPYGSKKNVLGEYWLKFNDDDYAGFGIHGTTDPTCDPKKPETIQRPLSAGCIRMFNRDVTEVSMFIPRGSIVEIRD
ncbi:MAG: L,D-transpeptidase family protein [Planctomycetota bacterium]|jgi:lipoprotein-anchoring transpeptidase ErfK/SrfK